MISDLLKYTLRFIAIVLVQVLLINNLNLSGSINPYIYILFILMLPVRLLGWQVLLIAFFTGLAVDLFSSTPGMHTAATVCMAYVRVFYVRWGFSQEDLENKIEATIAGKGLLWFVVYAAVLTFVHHLALFFIEVYGFHELLNTSKRVLFSSAVTLCMIILAQYLFFRVRPEHEQ